MSKLGENKNCPYLPNSEWTQRHKDDHLQKIPVLRLNSPHLSALGNTIFS